MKKKSTYHFRKTLRKYRNLQLRLKEATSPALLRQLSRKLDLLGRRLLRLNRSWKLGIATAALMAWMADPVLAQVFPASIDLSSLDSTQGFVIKGIDAYDRSGRSVSGAGDVNGDGIDDLIVGISHIDWSGLREAGESYVVFGANSFPDSLNLADLNGSNGFVIKGIDAGDNSGSSVSGAGDVNGDGMDDFIIGAPGADPDGNINAGKSYVVFGATTFADSLNLADLNGSNGFVIRGIDAYDRSGFSVSGAGDVNGDGMDDLIIGISHFDLSGLREAGESYVVFGANSFPGILNLAGLNGSNGFVINGIDAGDNSGFSVSGAGDVNGDGIDDLIIGAPFADPNGNSSAGESYVVFGANTLPASLNLADLNGSNGFVINGIDIVDESGYSVSGARDVNGDGIDDLIVGAPDGYFGYGESYVVFGANAFNDSLNLADLNGSNGFVIRGIDECHHLGRSVSGAGDVNGDGINELIIGAPGANGNGYAGESYVVFGSNTFPVRLSPVDLNGSNGFVINGIGAGDYSGFSVSGAGDVNGDGIDDLIIGADRADPNGNSDAGESYVIFGRDLNASLEALRPRLALEVVPNPTAGTLYLQAEPFGRAARVEIRLYDLMGREVAAPTQQVSSDRYQLDLQALPAGTYLLRAMADGEVGTSRVVKE
jgi:hypothetical protein